MSHNGVTLSLTHSTDSQTPSYPAPQNQSTLTYTSTLQYINPPSSLPHLQTKAAAPCLPQLTQMGRGNDNFATPLRFTSLLKHELDSDVELDEHDVVWPDPDSPLSDHEPETTFHPVHFPTSGLGLSAVFSPDNGMAVRRPSRSFSGRILQGSDPIAKSAPLNVPTWQKKDRVEQAIDEGYDGNFGGGEVEDENEEMVPPHVIVARSHVMAFSVFEGVGRTLKGRDLRRVRNAVFQQTGFLD